MPYFLDSSYPISHVESSTCGNGSINGMVAGVMVAAAAGFLLGQGRRPDLASYQVISGGETIVMQSKCLTRFDYTIR